MNNLGIKSSNPITGCYRTETILVSEQNLWKILPEECKNSAGLEEFKLKTKNGLPRNYICVYARHTIKKLVLLNLNKE